MADTVIEPNITFLTPALYELHLDEPLSDQEPITCLFIPPKPTQQKNCRQKLSDIIFQLFILGFGPVGDPHCELSEWWNYRPVRATQCRATVALAGLSALGSCWCCRSVWFALLSLSTLSRTHIGTQPPQPGTAAPKATVATVHPLVSPAKSPLLS